MDFISPSEYIHARKIALQNGIVNYRQANVNSLDSYVWAYRNTFCDVISVITTTVPISNGQMVDIKLPSKDLKRYKHVYLYNYYHENIFKHSYISINIELKWWERNIPD